MPINASRDPAKCAGRQPTPVNGTVPGRCGPQVKTSSQFLTVIPCKHVVLLIKSMYEAIPVLTGHEDLKMT